SDNHDGARSSLVPKGWTHRLSSSLVLPEICMEMLPPRIVREQLTRSELVRIASDQFGDMVKAVVDVERGIMALGGELHSDEEAVLLDDGSSQSNLWGINLYPSADEADWVEYDSMINVRPSQGNRTRGVEDAALRGKIRRIVNELVK
ncbi:MAG TPA: DUF5674 family protein, partial [Gemmatimonadaceae bacterium]|nr:DUF5674 family protein [Gemmatimonadaceae bacterium]